MVEDNLEIIDHPGHAASGRAGRRAAWLLALLMLAGLTCEIVASRPVVVYDEYGYAFGCRHLQERAREIVNEPDSLEAWRNLVNDVRSNARPPFYLPSSIIGALTRGEFSFDLALLLNAWIYLGLLFASVIGLSVRLSSRPEVAATGAACCLLLNFQLQESSLVLMGDMPVAALVGATLWAWVAILQGGQWRAHLGFGLALAFGLMTKPIFIFFALPIALHAGFRSIWTLLVRPEDDRRPLRFALFAVLAAVPPLVVLTASFDALWAFTQELYLVNEKLLYYQRGGDAVLNAAWAGTLFTQTYSIHVLPLLGLIWLVALRSRAGRWVWLITIPFLAYVCFLVNQRHARQFGGFFPAFALLTGLGVASLPRSFATWLGRLLVLLALLGIVRLVTGSTLGMHEVLPRDEFVFDRDAEGEFRWTVFEHDPDERSRGDEYRHLRVPEFVRYLGMLDDRDSTAFIAFSTIDLNWSTYQSYLFLEGLDDAGIRRFHSSQLRFGGFGAEGGLRPVFFESDRVVVKSGRIIDLDGGIDFYHPLICAELSTANSPLSAGLAWTGEFRLRDGESLHVFRRERQPTPREWAEITELLFEKDPENPWNLRYSLKVLERADEIEDPGLVRREVERVLSFAEPPGDSPVIRSSIPFARDFPALIELYEQAHASARLRR